MFIPSIPRYTSAKERVHQIRITAVTGGDLFCPESTVNSLVSREEGESDAVFGRATPCFLSFHATVQAEKKMETINSVRGFMLE